MQKVIFCALSFFMAGVLSVAAQETKINVQKGQKYTVETTTQLTNTVEAMGQSMETTSDSKSTILYEIMEAGKDGYSLQSTITKMLANLNMMGQSMAFDSEKKDNDGPMADVLSKLVNKDRALTIDTKGTITKQDAFEDAPEAAMVGVSGNNEVYTELFIPTLIGRKLKVGDSFPYSGFVKKEKYDSRDSGTYTIMAIENDIASISYTGTQVVSMVMEQMGMELTTNSNNIVKSELQVNVKTGLVLAKASVVETTSKMEVSGMEIPATGKTITTIKVSPAN
jgi:hypothetical protein